MGKERNKKVILENIIAAIVLGSLLIAAITPVKIYAPTHERASTTVYAAKDAGNDPAEEDLDRSGDAMPAVYLVKK